MSFLSNHQYEIIYYFTLFSVSIAGHILHWGKKAVVDKDNSCFFEHFGKNLPSTIVCLLTTIGVVYSSIDLLPEGISWKTSIIAAFTIGYSSDSAINNKFGSNSD